MQKENKVCNITPADRVGSVQEYYFEEAERGSRNECRRQECDQPGRR